MPHSDFAPYHSQRNSVERILRCSPVWRQGYQFDRAGAFPISFFKGVGGLGGGGLRIQSAESRS
jgi:hypothetical protein